MMTPLREVFLICLMLFGSVYGAVGEGLELDMLEPRHEGGALYTDGGVCVTVGDSKVFSRHAVYRHGDTSGANLIAYGMLRANLLGYPCVGSMLEYNRLTEEGVLYNGVMVVGPWYVKGEEIKFNLSGDISVDRAVITMDTSSNPIWKVLVKNLTLNKNDEVHAKHPKLIFAGRVPLIWVPSIHCHIKSVMSPPLRLGIKLDEGLGPRICIGYKCVNKDDLSMSVGSYIRAWNGGEISLLSKFCRKGIVADMYNVFGYDKFCPRDSPGVYSRFRGKLSVRRGYFIDSYYDWVSTPQLLLQHGTTLMRGSHIYFSNVHGGHIYGYKCSARLNTFNASKEELPVVFFVPRPVAFCNGKVVFSNKFKCGYERYLFSGLLRGGDGLRSMFLSTKHSIYFPLQGVISLIPAFEINTLTQFGDDFSFARGYLTSRCIAFSELQYGSGGKVIPYVECKKTEGPKQMPKIFSIDDALYPSGVIRYGVRSVAFMSNGREVSADLNWVSLFSDNVSNKTKLVCEVMLDFPYMRTRFDTKWDLQKNVLDSSSLSLHCTLSKHIGIKACFLHRGKESWRKCDGENFFLDASRSDGELIGSKLSDSRSTFISQIQMRVSPSSILRVKTCVGWGRIPREPYHENSLEITTTFKSGWRLRGGITETKTDLNAKHRLSLGISILKLFNAE